MIGWMFFTETILTVEILYFVVKFCSKILSFDFVAFIPIQK